MYVIITENFSISQEVQRLRLFEKQLKTYYSGNSFPNICLR